MVLDVLHFTSYRGEFALMDIPYIPGYLWTALYTPTDLELIFTEVSEPATWLVAGAALVLGLWGRRFTRRAPGAWRLGPTC